MESSILTRWLSTILTLPYRRIFISIRFPIMSIKIDLNQFQIYPLETLSFFFQEFFNFLQFPHLRNKLYAKEHFFR